MLYSVNGAFPTALPFRYTRIDGRTATAEAVLPAMIEDGYSVVPADPAPATLWNESATWDGTQWVVAPDPEKVQKALADALERIANGRWQHEIAGITYTRPSDGKTYGIATDRESQGKLDAERNAALAGLRAAGDVWKCLDVATGAMVWVPFTDGEIAEIAAAARAHVAGAFKREGELAALIAAGDPTVVWSPPA